MDSQTTQTIKLPILQPSEYDLWKMRMKQYLQCVDYTLWEIIENGNAPIVTKTVDGKETVIPPTSVEENGTEGRSCEARITLIDGSYLMCINYRFNSFKDAKTLKLAIEKDLESMVKLSLRRHQSEVLEKVCTEWPPRNQDNKNKEPIRRTVPVEETTSDALVSQCDSFGYD
ncbi:hypothetical protein Tco_1438696 [Tanacetum coccineum]